MSDPTEEFGKLEPSAQFLLERSGTLALNSGQEFDPLHIMLVALTEPTTAGSAAQSLSAFLTEDHYKTCVAAIQVQLQLNSRPAASSGALSLNLQECLDRWKAEAQRRSLRVTETLIVWAIVSFDSVVSQILRTLAVDLHALERDLEGRFEVTSKLPPPRFGQSEEARNHVEIISPSIGCHFASSHAVLMSNVLNVLGALDHSQIAILTGPNGTPIHHVEQALADLLALGASFSDERPRLQHDYQGVYRLNMTSLRAIAERARPQNPAEILQAMLTIAAQQRAILVISGLEWLREQTPVDQELLAVLENPGDSLILGLYEMPPVGVRSPDEALKLSNMVHIAAHSYSPMLTKELLRKYYLPHWIEKYGIDFTEDAFDHVIALEPGAWIKMRRMTLPYLVIGLASDVIQTVQGGESLIRETLIMALDALEKLRDEWATTEMRIRDKYEHVLEQAHDEIATLLQEPLPIKNAEGRLMLTRAYMSAQLICPNDSEFHYPGHAPEQLSAHLRDDFPTHLLNNYSQAFGRS